MTRRLLPALLAAAALGGCGGGTARAPEGAGGPALVVVPPGATAPPGDGAVARAEIAATPEARERGLMGRELLPPDTGMLFVYPSSRPLQFWMKDCRCPLAAAFLDESGLILNVVEMAPGDGVPDLDLPRYASAGPARFVLEMESGWFARKGLRPGDRADVSAALRGVVAR